MTILENETDRRSAYLNKVRALLAQAEDPGTTPEEAQSFSAKAQELMEKYAFSVIELELAGQRERDEIVHVDIFVEAPYAKAKQDLYFRIACANNVKMVVSSDCRRAKTVKNAEGRFEIVRDSKGRKITGGWVYLTGFRTDVDNVEILFTSLHIQATHEVLSADQNHWENTKSFRNAFFYGYSHAIGDRLAAVRREVQKQEVVRVQEATGTNLLPVLVARKAQVEEEFHKYHGRPTGKVTATYQRNTGYTSGQAAASRADIGQRRVGSRKALTS